MKLFLLVCCSALFMLSTADEPPAPDAAPTHTRGCIYILGRCARECEEGTHAYALGCGHKTPEATCAQPHPQPETAILCDYSACYCDEPTVRDETTGKCVQLDQCSKA